MLSKSQARTFFIGGTAFFAIIFLALTIDSMTKVPALSHEKNMTPSVVRGKQIWDDNNCMGCHTLLGEGAYYAPELTKVYERRGETWMRLFLKDPQAMFPGQRKMVQYHFNDDQISDVIAFLKWIGEIDTNGFPPKPDIVMASAPPPAIAVSAPSAVNADQPPPPPQPQAGADVAARPQIFGTVCIACHALHGTGGAVGPALDGVADRYKPEQLDTWLKDPQAVKPGTLMPNLSLDEATRAELVKFLMTQHAAK